MRHLGDVGVIHRTEWNGEADPENNEVNKARNSDGEKRSKHPRLASYDQLKTLQVLFRTFAVAATHRRPLMISFPMDESSPAHWDITLVGEALFG